MDLQFFSVTFLVNIFRLLMGCSIHILVKSLPQELTSLKPSHGLKDSVQYMVKESHHEVCTNLQAFLILYIFYFLFFIFCLVFSMVNLITSHFFATCRGV